MYDVITIGSNTLDVFAYTDRSESICIKTIEGEECYISYPSGSKLLINELDFDTGGGGTNTAVALSRMGLSVGYVGRLGSDDSAEKVLEELAKESIDFLGSRSKQKKDKTGYSIILDLDNFHFKILRKANRLKVNIFRCPWHHIMITSGRQHLFAALGSIVCDTQYGIWASEFGKSLKFELKNTICGGDHMCVLEFRKID